MAFEIVMPKMGLTMEEGTILSWLKKEGDAVTQGETILQIETDKVTIDIEAPASGRMGAILSPQGATVPIGQVITHVLVAGEEEPAAAAVSIPPAERATTPEASAGVAPSARRAVAASPVARRVAGELGVDLNTVVGSGPQGRIMEEDVRCAAVVPCLGKGAEAQRSRVAEASPPASPPGVVSRSVRPAQGVRRITAERMTHSFTTTPHFYLSVEADAGSLVKMRERLLAPLEQKAGARVTISDLLVKIVAQTLEEHPEVNAVWDGNGVRSLDTIDVGLAAATDRGLIVPVLRDVNHKSLVQLVRERSALVDKARAGALSLQDVEGGSITLSNLGAFAVDQFSAIINPPQAAILAVGRIKERPFAVEGQLTLRPTVFLTLSIDHRVLDGAQAAQMFSRLVALVEEPYLLMPLD